MSNVLEIESAIAKLPVREMEQIRDWLDEILEDQMEVSDAFKAKLLRAKAELSEGVYSRTRQPS